MYIAIGLHVLASTIWVGGMFFSYLFLRPVVASELEPPQRLRVMASIFGKFFSWVWLVVATLILSGHFMIAQYGGMANIGAHIHVMLLLGYIMIGVFIYIYCVPFIRLKKEVEQENWAVAAKQMNIIKNMVLLNLVAGIVTIVTATAGPYLML